MDIYGDFYTIEPNGSVVGCVDNALKVYILCSGTPQKEGRLAAELVCKTLKEGISKNKNKIETYNGSPTVHTMWVRRPVRRRRTKKRGAHGCATT